MSTNKPCVLMSTNKPCMHYITITRNGILSLHDKSYYMTLLCTATIMQTNKQLTSKLIASQQWL